MRSASSTIWSQAAQSANVTSGCAVSGWLDGNQTRFWLRVSGSASALPTMKATSSSPLISRCSRKRGASSVT